MCESCSANPVNRREFLAAGGALGAAGVLSTIWTRPATGAAEDPAAARSKTPPRVVAVFLYPPADVVYAGELEDAWRTQQWFTWPGNQFEPEQQQQAFTARIQEICDRLGIAVEFEPQAIYQEAKVNECIERTKAKQVDAILVVNFWNSFSPWSARLATESAPTAIVYHSVGSNHQLPPEYLRNAAGLYYIHSIENWDEIERGLRAVRARKMLAQSRLLRISGKTQEVTRDTEPLLDVDVVTAPADEFNATFDAIEPDAALVQAAMEFKSQAARVTDVTDEYLVEALRAHRAVGQIMQRYEADAITIECLFLKHRKPCVSFAIHNGALTPCGCENHLDGTLTLMLGRWLLDRPGFLHNPEFDTSENRYLGAHCTCAWKLHGPEQAAQEFHVRPFFHQLPKTPALDVQWTTDEPVMLARYASGKDTLCCWTGKVLYSPTSPPVGGCATRVLVEFDRTADVCEVYRGPHPVLFCGTAGDARRFKAFARMYRLTLEGNLG